MTNNTWSFCTCRNSFLQFTVVAKKIIIWIGKIFNFFKFQNKKCFYTMIDTVYRNQPISCCFKLYQNSSISKICICSIICITWYCFLFTISFFRIKRGFVVFRNIIHTFNKAIGIRATVFRNLRKTQYNIRWNAIGFCSC